MAKLTGTDYVNLFGEPVDMSANRRSKSPKKRGYAWPPGTGPSGETCGSCRHIIRVQSRFPKCNLTKWTNGAATDILVRSPACKFWEAKDQDTEGGRARS